MVKGVRKTIQILGRDRGISRKNSIFSAPERICVCIWKSQGPWGEEHTCALKRPKTLLVNHVGTLVNFDAVSLVRERLRLLTSFLPTLILRAPDHQNLERGECGPM